MSDDIDNEINPDDDYNDYMRGEHTDNEDVQTRSTTEAFFTPEDLLYQLEKNFKGYTKSDGKWVYKNNPIARDEFINMIINGLRSIVNSNNMISKMSEDDLAIVLLEKNTEIIFSALEEPTIDEDDYEYIINTVDHTMQLFVGHLVKGHGSKVARQMSANIYHEQDKNSDKKRGFFDTMMDQLNDK